MAETIQEFILGLAFGKADDKNLKDAEKSAGDAADNISKKWTLSFTEVKSAIDLASSAVRGMISIGKGLFNLVDAPTKVADAIAKAARNAGTATDEFQKLVHAANLSDVPMATLARTVQDLGRQILAVEGGAIGPFSDALSEVGLRLSDLGGTPSENLGKIFDALNRVPDSARRASLSVELLGRGGRQMGSLIAEGSEGLHAMMEEAERLGLVLDADALAASESFQDSLTRMEGAIGTAAQKIGIALAPAVEDIVIDITEWVAANQDYLANDTSDAIGDLANAFRDLAPSIELVTDGLQLVANVATGLKIELAATFEQMARLASFDFSQDFDETRRQVAQTFATQRQNELTDQAERREERRRERAAGDTLAQQERLLTSGPIAQSVNRAARTTLAEQQRLQREFEAKQRKGGRGGKRQPGTPDFEVEDFELLEAEDVLGADLDRLAERVGATPEQRQAALEAGSSSLARGASPAVALKAATSQLSSLTGVDVSPSKDPLLSEIFGENVPDVELSKLAMGAQPQTLIATINNTFTTEINNEINGAGNPSDVAAQVVQTFKTVIEDVVSKSTKTAGVPWAR